MIFIPLEDILDFPLGPEYYEERVQKRYDYIQEQLKLDPEYVGYDYLEYRDPHSDTLWSSIDYLVDTKGNVYLNKSGTWTLSKSKSKYGQQLSINKKLEYFQKSRLIAHMFIPRPESLSKMLFYKLDVKYKDREIWNNNLCNLEWVCVKRQDEYLPNVPSVLTEILELKYDETMPYEERVQKRYNYVKEQLELDPNYEGWDYPEHIKGRTHFCHIVGTEYLISTSGRTISLHRSNRGFKVLFGTTTKDGYNQQCLYIKQNRYHCNTHRVLCSTFVPKPSHYKQNLNWLEVNHKDLNKLNNHFTNLEWCTSQENTHHHLIEYGNTTTFFNGNFQGTIELDCKYKGYKFKVFGSEGLKNIGLCSRALSDYFAKSRKYYFGCTWKFITQEETNELPDIPEFIKNKFLNDKNYLNNRSVPLKGIVVKDCVYTGLRFVLYGNKEIKMTNLDKAAIAKSIRDKTIYQGCLFEYISRDEAELLQRGLTKEQKEYLIDF